MFTYLHQGETYTVQLEQQPDGTYRATLGDRVYVVTADTIEGGWTLTFPEQERHVAAYVAAEGDARMVSVGGEVYTLTPETARRSRRSGTAAAHGGAVTAPMPGQVREVLVAEGAAVQRGQALVILEAMKMELRATAPADGVVKRLLVTAGDVVSRGQALAEIEELAKL